MKQLLFVLILISLMLAACGSPASEPARTKTVATWSSIKITQSGGIAGVLRSLEISRDGHGSAVDERAGKKVEVMLSAEQVAQLDAVMMSSTKLPAVQLDLNCADCFVYALEVAFPSKTKTVQLNDTQLATSGYEPLVTFLRLLMDAALQ